jgi:linoleoyl-CoA desaturase
VLREVLNSYAMFAVAAPAHFPAEAKFVKAESEGRGLLASQIYTTVNFRPGFWGGLVCLGSEYQIEHHLLPTANPYRLARVSQIVEAFCRRYGYPYRTLGWWEAIMKSLHALRSPKPVYTVSDLIDPVGYSPDARCQRHRSP